MNQAPVVGIHWVQIEGLARFPDQLGEFFHFLNKPVVPHIAEMLHIQVHFGRIWILCLQYPVEEKLKVFQHLAIFADQLLFFAGIDLEQQSGFGFDLFDLKSESEVPEHCIENFLRRLTHGDRGGGGFLAAARFAASSF